MQYCLLAHDTRYQAPFFVAANSKSVPTASRVQRSAFLLSRPPPYTREPITPPPPVNPSRPPTTAPYRHPRAIPSPREPLTFGAHACHTRRDQTPAARSNLVIPRVFLSELTQRVRMHH